MPAATAERAAPVDPQLEQVLINYGRLAGMLDPNRLEVWEELGLTMSQLRVLHLLNMTRFALAGTVAEVLKVRPSTATGIVDRLVRQGLVDRQRDPEDRRCVRIYLTESGREVIGEIRQGNEALLSRLFRRFTAEQIEMVAQAFELITQEGEQLGLIIPWPPEPGID